MSVVFSSGTPVYRVRRDDILRRISATRDHCAIFNDKLIYFTRVTKSTKAFLHLRRLNGH